MKKLFFLLSIIGHLQATILIPGTAGSGAALSFTTPVLATAFDTVSGTFYVGLAGNGSVITLQAAPRALPWLPSPGTSFQPIGSDVNSIEFITLLAKPGSPAYAIAYVDLNVMPLMATMVNVINRTGTALSMVTILDASGALNMNGSVTTGIVGLTAAPTFIFAAVSPANGNTFGMPDSGIAVIGVNPTSLEIIQIPAVDGDNGTKAVPLDDTTPAVNVPSSSPNNPTLFPNGINFPIPPLDMVWDNQLQRLYIPLIMQLNMVGGSGGRSIVMGRFLDTFGHLELDAIAPDSAFDAGDTHEIVGFLKTGADTSSTDLTINKVRVMHCTTGPSYLIVNGDVGDPSVTGNLFYALPLVDVKNANNPAQGTLADKNSALVNGTFVVPAVAPADMTLNTDTAALVGAGPLPMEAGILISDMVVLNDTVYVSLNTIPSLLNDTGILYSQALFDENGKIISWTPWTRHAFPIGGFPEQNDQIFRFAIDGATGIIWAVDGQTHSQVVTTAWNMAQITPSTPSGSLVAQLNALFANCMSTSVLDLDQSTAGFFNGPNMQPFRYALFGGPGTVIFAVTSQAMNNTLDSPQTVTTDFSAPGYLLKTLLPTSCPVTALEYSRQAAGIAQNYFFAGTQDGLFVFADALGNGFDSSSLGLLNAPPFTNHGWIKIDPNLIPGSIIDIKTSGLALYVLTYNSTPQAPMQNTLYRIPFQSSIAAMFNPANISIIAQTGVGVFANVLIFSGMQIIMTSPTSDQIVLATNQGLFRTAVAGGVQNATSQAAADWQPIDNDLSYFNGIAGVNNATRFAYTGGFMPSLPTKVWPFAFQSPTIANIFNRSIWDQVVGSTDSGAFNFGPANFNATIVPGFQTLPLTTFFWSDGGRRFAVVNPLNTACRACPKTGVTNGRHSATQCPAQDIYALPFNVTNFGISGANSGILSNQTLDLLTRFYWISDIGATGLILAGTNGGVVSLE